MLYQLSYLGTRLAARAAALIDKAAAAVHPAGAASAASQRRVGSTRWPSRVAEAWADAVHALRELPYVIDLRNIGLIGAIELEPRAGAPGARAFDAMRAAFEAGLLIRVTGDIIALSPPLIIEPAHIDRLFSTLERVLRGLKG